MSGIGRQWFKKNWHDQTIVSCASEQQQTLTTVDYISFIASLWCQDVQTNNIRPVIWIDNEDYLCGSDFEAAIGAAVNCVSCTSIASHEAILT